MNVSSRYIHHLETVEMGLGLGVADGGLGLNIRRNRCTVAYGCLKSEDTESTTQEVCCASQDTADMTKGVGSCLLKQDKSTRGYVG